MEEYSLTNRSIKFAAYGMLVIAILGFLILGNTLTITEPDIELTLTGGVIEGDEIPHPQRWLFAFIFLGTGIFYSLILFAISEALTRLHDMADYSRESSRHLTSLNHKASS